MESGDYITLFPGSTREKARFMAIATVVLQQVIDLQAVVGQINGAFASESALGNQLDALAASLDLSRLDTSDGAAVADADFRDFIVSLSAKKPPAEPVREKKSLDTRYLL